MIGADCKALRTVGKAWPAGWHHEPTGSFLIDYLRCRLMGRHFAVRLRHEGENRAVGIETGVKLSVDEAVVESGTGE